MTKINNIYKGHKDKPYETAIKEVEMLCVILNIWLIE